MIEPAIFLYVACVKMSDSEPELPGGFGGAHDEVEPGWKRYSDSRRRARAAYEERERCAGGRGSRKRVVLSQEIFRQWKRLKEEEFGDSTDDEFASSLLDRCVIYTVKKKKSRPSLGSIESRSRYSSKIDPRIDYDESL